MTAFDGASYPLRRPATRPVPTCRRCRRRRRLAPAHRVRPPTRCPPSIHEIIGRGRQSKVYKARLKQSLEYVVVKACAKDRKPRVLQEVRCGALQGQRRLAWLLLSACVQAAQHIPLELMGVLLGQVQLVAPQPSKQLLHAARQAAPIGEWTYPLELRMPPPVPIHLQVKVLNSMSHPNLLRFHTWCGRGHAAAGCQAAAAACHACLGLIVCGCILPAPRRRHAAAFAFRHHPVASFTSLLMAACACSCRYETQNHLWVILEYCVGGDLLALLRSDGRLPEASGAQSCWQWLAIIATVAADAAGRCRWCC